VKDAAHDVTHDVTQDLTQDVTEDVSGAAEDGYASLGRHVKDGHVKDAAQDAAEGVAEGVP